MQRNGFVGTSSRMSTVGQNQQILT